MLVKNIDVSMLSRKQQTQKPENSCQKVQGRNAKLVKNPSHANVWGAYEICTL